MQLINHACLCSHNFSQCLNPSIHTSNLHHTASSSTNDQHSLRERQASSVLHSNIPHNENTSQLHLHRSWIHWKCICHHCCHIFDHLQLPRQCVFLQAHPISSFCLWTAPSHRQKCIFVVPHCLGKNACSTHASTTSACNA